MAKQQNNTPIIILGIIIVVLILNPSGIREKITERFSTFSTVESIILETEEGECSLSLTKYLVEPGELVRGTIQDGAFADCDIYVRFEGVWTNIGTYITDDTGEFSYETTAPLVPGSYEILAVCTDTLGSCRTNTEILTVITPDEPDVPDAPWSFVVSVGIQNTKL